jgi:PAS domain S-box-containing protein
MLTEILIAVVASLMFFSLGAFVSFVANPPMRYKSAWFMLPACSLLCFVVVIQVLTDELDSLLFLRGLGDVLFAVIITSFIFFVMEFTRIDDPTRPNVLIPFLTAPILLAFVVATDPWLHLYYQSSSMVQSGLLTNPVLTVSHGIAYWMWAAYAWTAGAYFAFIFYRHISGLGETVVARMFILGGLIVSFAVVASYLFDVLNTASITGLSFTAAILLVYYGSSYSGLFNLVPTGRKKMLDIIQDLIVVVDTNGIIEDINRPCEDYLGRALQHAVGLPFAELFSKMPELTKAMNHVGETKTRFEVSDPSGRCFEATIINFTYGHSAKIGKMVTLRDITEKKRLEEDHRKAKMEGETLRSQRVESLGLLAGGIAHDFNNSLSSIVSNIELVRNRVDGDGESLWRLSKAEKAAMNARRLSEQLLTFSKGGKPIREAMDVSETARNSVYFALSGSNIKPVFVFEPGPFTVMADPGQLEQVFNNLVINAKQAMPHGGELEIIAKKVGLYEQDSIPLEDGEYVSIEFKDHGHGIPEEHLGKIFDPFFTTKAEGKGLGLTTALSIIKNHDGSIQPKSEVGVGTSMTVYLPVSEARIDEPNQMSSGRAPRGSGNVLIMDDEEEIVDVLRTLLVEIGYSVTTSGNGEEAIAAYRKAMDEANGFDAVIMDLTIKGGMGGKEAIREIQAIDPNVKAIVSSGYSNDPIMADPNTYGFIGVLPKPYTLKELRETVQKVVRTEVPTVECASPSDEAVQPPEAAIAGNGRTNGH